MNSRFSGQVNLLYERTKEKGTPVAEVVKKHFERVIAAVEVESGFYT
jgi:hypothetical protein